MRPLEDFRLGLHSSQYGLLLSAGVLILHCMLQCARGLLVNFSTSTRSLRRPGLVLVSGSSLPRACAHVKESLARPIPGIADAGKNAVMKVMIDSGRVDTGSGTEHTGTELVKAGGDSGWLRYGDYPAMIVQTVLVRRALLTIWNDSPMRSRNRN